MRKHLLTIDEYSYIASGRKVTIPKGERFFEVTRPNTRWVLASRTTDSVEFFLPSRVLTELSLPLMESGKAEFTPSDADALAHSMKEHSNDANDPIMNAQPRQSGKTPPLTETLPLSSESDPPSKQLDKMVNKCVDSDNRPPAPVDCHSEFRPETPVGSMSIVHDKSGGDCIDEHRSQSAHPPDNLTVTNETGFHEKVIVTCADHASRGPSPIITLEPNKPDLSEIEIDVAQPEPDEPHRHSPVILRTSHTDSINRDPQADRTQWHCIIHDGEEHYVNVETNERWIAAVDPQGQTYYYEPNSRRSVWFLDDLSPETQIDTALPTASPTSVCDHDLLPTNELPLSRSPDPHLAHTTPESVTSARNSGTFPLAKPHGDFDQLCPPETSSVLQSTQSKSKRTKFLSKKSQPADSNSSSQWDSNASVDSTRFSLMAVKKEDIGEPTDPKLVSFERRALVEWTKYMEKGNRVPERWSSALIVLSGHFLLLYKDIKSATPKQSQPFGKYTVKFHVPHLLVTDASESDTKKENVLKLEMEDASDSVITSALVAFPSPVLDSWKAAILCAKHLVIEGRLSAESNYCAPRPVSKLDGKLLVKLREFFLRRPTAESLRSRGILKNESVFASSLVQICESESTDVPRFVVNVIRAIESRGLHHRGIYRVAGNAAVVQKLRCCVNQGNYSLDSNKWPLEVLTDSLKLFFRELKEPLFICELFPKFSALLEQHGPSASEAAVRIATLINSMPAPHISTARMLFQHLKKVMQLSDTNQMTAGNLATVFGPGLLRADPDFDQWGALAVQVPFVNFCLEHVDDVFAATGHK